MVDKKEKPDFTHLDLINKFAPETMYEWMFHELDAELSSYLYMGSDSHATCFFLHAEDDLYVIAAYESYGGDEDDIPDNREYTRISAEVVKGQYEAFSNYAEMGSDLFASYYDMHDDEPYYFSKELQSYRERNNLDDPDLIVF